MDEKTKEQVDQETIDTINAYVQDKYDKGGAMPTRQEIGFVLKNRLAGKRTEEIDALIASAKKLSNGELIGLGDQFKRWCTRNGRMLPPDDLVDTMNSDPPGAGEEVRKLIPEHPEVYRNYCTFIAGKGRR